MPAASPIASSGWPILRSFSMPRPRNSAMRSLSASMQAALRLSQRVLRLNHLPGSNLHWRCPDETLIRALIDLLAVRCLKCRSEEHTSELHELKSIPYALLRLKKKKHTHRITIYA